MRRIKLTRGYFALVDDEDYNYLSQWNWHVHYRRGYWYAARCINLGYKKTRTISMHRLILGLEHRDKQQGDHANHNTLDNRRSNLRMCTRKQNAQNRKSNQYTTSKYKGVSWHAHTKKWQAQLRKNKKNIYIGVFTLEKEAALAYNEAAKKYFGNFAFLNVIGER